MNEETSTEETSADTPEKPTEFTWATYRTLEQGYARKLLRALAVRSKGRMATMAKALGVDRKTLIRERADDAWFAGMIDRVKREHREHMANGGYARNAKLAAKKKATQPKETPPQ